MLNKTKSSSSITQAVISTDQNFILAKSIGNFTDIISPFKKTKDRYSSKFTLPINQLHRVQTLYDSISGISQYTVIDDSIKFDCVSNLPQDMFGQSQSGYIHFSSVKQIKNEKANIVVDPKLVFSDVEGEIHTFKYEQKIKFKSDFLKAFPIILRPGFMFSTVNKILSQLFISVINPSKGLIGECSKYEVVNIIQYLLPLWPIFEINIGKTIQIKFQDDFIKDYYKDIQEPILLYINYNLENPEIINMAQFGKNIPLENLI